MELSTSVNPQIPDAAEPAGAAPADPAASAAPAAPADGVTQAILLANGATPAKAIAAALGSMAQAAGLQMAAATASYQSWTTVQHAIASQAAGEIFAAATPFDAPASAGKTQGA